MIGLLERATGFVFLEPDRLWLALLLPLVLWLRARRPQPSVAFGPAALFGADAPPLPRSWRVRTRAAPLLLALVAWLTLLLALARPVERVALPLQSRGLDVLLCLDTSSSMTALDLDPTRTRLDLARDAASAFVDSRSEDRLGLLAFARYPDLRCPLTRDHAALKEILAAVDTVESDGPEDATGLGTALARAADVLDGAGTRAGVVVFLTDGEENVALAGQSDEIAPVHAAQLCEQLGIRVYTIVVGLGRRSSSGAWVALDTRAVEQVATRTGGAFHSARDADGVRRVYDRIARLEKAPFEEPRFRVEDRHVAFLLAGLLLLLLARLLGAYVWEVRP